jgi:hypothetical protein
MPCGCRVPAEKYPETADWGPLFWRLLHGLAEFAGSLNSGVSNTIEVLQADERREWFLVLTVLQEVLPCEVCKEHYGRWIAKHKPILVKELPYAHLNTWVRTFLWRLHNEINTENDKNTFSYASLTDTYKGTEITKAWKQLEPVILRAIKLNGLTLFPWKKWLGHVRMLQGIYGV